MAEPDGRVIRAKLTGPEPHPLAVDRPAALGRLDDALDLDGSVAILTMPGYGRRDLLARWIRSHANHPTAWMSVDEWDDGPRLFRHAVASLGSLHGDVGRVAATVVDQGIDAIREVGIPSLAAELEALGGPFTWVVEGVHRLVDPEARAGIRALQQYRPAALRVVFISDDEGGLDLRSADGTMQLPRLDETHLAFTADQVDEMFDRAGVRPSSTELDALMTATAGWPLVVLDTLTTSTERGRFTPHDPFEPERAARLHRAICRPLPADLRTLVSDLALLGPVASDRFQEVTDRPDAGRPIERLRRRHLVRRDHGRLDVVEPVRAHLVHEREGEDAAAVRFLRRRLAHLLADDGRAAEAVRVFERSGDREASVRMLLARHRQWSAAGEAAVVMKGVTDGLVHDPSLVELFLVKAWLELFSGDDAEIERSVALAAAHPLDGVRRLVIESELEMLRAMLARRGGRMDDCLFHAIACEEIGAKVDRSGVDDVWAEYSMLVPDRLPLYLGHCLLHAGELEDARVELLRGNLSRAWSRPALGALHGALALVGWLLDDGSAPIHAAIAYSNVGDEITGNDHLAAAMFALTAEGDDAARAADRHAEAAGRIDEPAARVLASVIAAHRADDAHAARVALAAARAEVERCEQPGVLSTILARAASALDVSDDDVVPGLGEELTDGERRVVLALRGDLTEREIAAELHLSHNTVRAYRRRAYRKLGVATRADAVRRLEERGA